MGTGYSVSNDGRVHIVDPTQGPLDLESSAVDIELTGQWNDEEFGDAVSVGDVDGDGRDDLLVGGEWGGPSDSLLGGAYLFFGPLVSGTYSDAAPLQIYGQAAYDQLGNDAAIVTDHTGDGVPDLLIGAPGVDMDPVANAGHAYLFDGTSTGILSPADALTTMHGATSAAKAGVAVLDAGDVDGDGEADLLIGAEGLDVGGVFSGGAYLVHGPVPGGVLDLDLDADARIEGTELSYAGRALAAADLDGDGYSDVVVGAHSYNQPVPYMGNTGVACVLRGPVPAQIALEAGSVCVYGAGSTHAGAMVDVGDVDHDGQLDLIVGGYFEAWVFDGATTGNLDPADAFLVIDDLGVDGIMVDDLDGDGLDDLAVMVDASVWLGLTTAF